LLAWIVSDVRGGLSDLLQGLLPVLSNTVLIGGSVALLTVVSSWVIYLAQRWTHFRGFFALIAGTTVAYALPGTLLAVAFYMPAVALENSVSWELGLTSSIGLTIFVLMLRFQAVSHNTLGPSMRAIPVRLEDAARSLRAGSLRVVWSLFRPNLQTASGLAAMLVFIDVVEELPLTMMMRPFGWDTLAIKVFEFSGDGDWYRAAVPALILIVLSSSSALLLATRVVRGEATAC
jgi:iron(III) transport system permease protein